MSGGPRGPDKLPRRLWTAEDDERLRAMMAENMARKDIAAALDRTENAVQDRCTKFGLKFDQAASRARAAASMSKVYSDPAYKAKLRKAISKAWSPERKAWMAEQARERRFWEAGHAALAADPEARERQRSRAAKAGREYGEKRMSWCPPHLRDEYRKLTRSKNLTPAEARAYLNPKIEAFARTFEGQLWRLATGKARLVENVKVTRPATYVPTEYCGAMS